MDSKESEGPNPSVKLPCFQGPLVIMENVKFPTYGWGQLSERTHGSLGPNVERQTGLWPFKNPYILDPTPP